MRTIRTAQLLLLLSSTLLLIPAAFAVPSFARQTGLQCGGCHTRFPELNAFGRQFKLNGYNLVGTRQIRAADGQDKETLAITELPPLSVMFQGAYTATAKSVPDTQNDDVQFPQQMSVFLAGKIAPGFGSFMQFTYTQEDDKFGMDNVDLRYANSTQLAGKPLQYGVTLNNSPTVEDLWGSTPTWGFPWAAPDVSPGPAAATLIDGGLAQDVAGLGGYALLDDSWYAAATLYRSAHLGSSAPGIGSENTIEGVAPYWRLAWQKGWGPNYLEIGTYGLHASLKPDGVSGPTDDYTDLAGDFQYQRTIGDDLLTLHGTYIREDQDLDASFASDAAAGRSNDLDTLRFDASYHRGRWAGTLGLFSTRGGRDSALYAQEPVDGSVNGKPDSNGYIAQVAYYPWQNTEFLLQYTGYDKFNGRSNSYDGFGRDASDNNAIYVGAWLVW
ncbi:MAG: hypothetical protein R3E86_14295 [Pseudomonadales bacterium]